MRVKSLTLPHRVSRREKIKHSNLRRTGPRRVVMLGPHGPNRRKGDMACDDRHRHRTLVILAIRRSVEHPLHGSGLSDKRSLRMAVGTVLFRRPVGESRFGQ